MKSPNGLIEVVRTKSFTPANFGRWCGWIEIPGSQFSLFGRRFTEQMAFSPDSRFLALTEMTVDGKSRITMLDFCSGKESIAHEPEDRYETASVHDWTDQVTLRIGIFSLRQGSRTQMWVAAT